MKIQFTLSGLTLAAALLLAPGCGEDDAKSTGDGGSGTAFATSTGSWQVYDGATAAQNIAGTAKAYDLGGGKTKVVLEVSGLAPMTTYGAHVHKLACGEMMGGGHYQHTPSGDAAATDPAFANAMNEVWLDFTTDAMGKGTKETTVNFRPRSGDAKAVVVHAMATGPGGVAGMKLACLNIAF